MKAELKQAWIDALLSGKYTQAAGVLHSEEGGYCCLGVLHEVAGGKWMKRPYPTLIGADPGRLVFKPARVKDDCGARNGQMPSVERLEAMGLDQYLGDDLAEMNDAGDSFEEIARWIKENVEVDG